MYCLSCGSSIPEDAPFCLKCGRLAPKGQGPTQVGSSPSDPYNSPPRPATSYGPPEGLTHNPYAPQSPLMPPAPPPPRRRNILPAILISILVLLLLSVGLGTFLLLKHDASSASIAHSATPAATPHPTTASTSSTTTTNILQSLPSTWTLCAVETAICQFSGTMTVAFGANGSFTYATESNGTACTIDIFGDPLHGIQKSCYIDGTPSTANIWTQCAAENATCQFSGTMTVAFGANGSYKYATKTNGTDCNIDIFGDPLHSVAKYCYLLPSPPSTTTWNTCATENGTCAFTGKHEVAYGASGKYFYGSFTNGITCANSFFSDPAPGVMKTCYYQQ